MSLSLCMWVCGCDADEWLFESTVKAQLRFHQDKGNSKLCTLTRVWAHPNRPAKITERPLLWTRAVPRRYAMQNWLGRCWCVLFCMCAQMHACIYIRKHFVLIILLVTCSMHFPKGCEFTHFILQHLTELYMTYCPCGNYEIDSYSIFFKMHKVYLFVTYTKN